jgi:hypothetical protein
MPKSLCTANWRSKITPTGSAEEDDGFLFLLDDGSGNLNGIHTSAAGAVTSARGTCMGQGMSIQRPANGPPEVMYEGHINLDIDGKTVRNVIGRYRRFDRSNGFEKFLAAGDDGDWTGVPVT